MNSPAVVAESVVAWLVEVDFIDGTSRTLQLRKPTTTEADELVLHNQFAHIANAVRYIPLSAAPAPAEGLTGEEADRLEVMIRYFYGMDNEVTFGYAKALERK